MKTQTCNIPSHVDWLAEDDPFQSVYNIVADLERTDRLAMADHALQFAFSIIADLLEEKGNTNLEVIKNTLDTIDFEGVE